MDKLKEILQSKVTLTETDWQFLASKLQEHQFSKKEILTPKGTVENRVFFILEGVFIIYLELPEKDVTVGFGFPNEFISSYSSFLTRLPSEGVVQSLTHCKALSITHNDLLEVYKNTASGESIGRVFAEEFFRYKSKRELSFLKESPTQRYLNLFKEQPHLIREIPQVYLASYIGITPQALSRIRAKLY